MAKLDVVESDSPLLSWDIYEISSEEPIHGVMFRGRIRKYCISEGINVLVENASDMENTVRFALIHNTNPDTLLAKITEFSQSANVRLVSQSCPCPVLSKLNINISERYEIE